MFKNLYVFLSKINYRNILIIFVFGFVSRIIVNSYFDINVFYDYLNPVSIFYYLGFSSFIVLVQEYGNHLPSFGSMIGKINHFIIDSLSNIKKFNCLDFKLSDIKRVFKIIL